MREALGKIEGCSGSEGKTMEQLRYVCRLASHKYSGTSDNELPPQQRKPIFNELIPVLYTNYYVDLCMPPSKEYSSKNVLSPYVQYSEVLMLLLLLDEE